MTNEEMISKIVEFRLCYEKDKTNDYYLIQYLGAVLDYIEREHTGFLSDLGRQSLALDIGTIHRRILTAAENKDAKLPQKDLVRFCLYMTDAYAVCVMFIGMVDVAFEENSSFLENHQLPSLVVDDLKDLAVKAKELETQFKAIMDKYSKFLEGKYKTIYNEEKHKGFVKQIFNQYEVKQSVFRPQEIMNAKECK